MLKPHAWHGVPSEPETKTGCRTIKHVFRLTTAGILISGICYAATHSAGVKVTLGTFLYWIQGLGPWGLVVLFAVYVVSVVFMLPTTLLNLGAGYCFGVWLGFPCILLAALLGATIAFLLGRTLARDCVSSCFGEYNSYLARVDEGLLQGNGAFKFVFLSRVPPCMPFPIMNYLYGTTGVNLRTYVSGTAVGLMPGTFLYVYMGHALHSLVDLLSGNAATLSLQHQVLFVVGVVLTIVVSLYLANEARLVGMRPLPAERALGGGEPRPSAEVQLTPSSGMGREVELEEDDVAEDVALLVDFNDSEPPEVQQTTQELLQEQAEADVEDGFVSWLATFDSTEFASAMRKWWWS